MDAKTPEHQNFSIDGEEFERSRWSRIIDCIVKEDVQTEKEKSMNIIVHLNFYREDGEDIRGYIPAIKLVREALSCGLKEAKDLLVRVS